jgi:hypothetical protein
MAVKQCKLVQILRRPVDVNLRKDYEEEYYHSVPPTRWNRFRSNAEVFNKRDAEKDLIPYLQSRSSDQFSHNHQCIPTEFVLVEYIDKANSFGWAIYREFADGGKQWLGGLHWPTDGDAPPTVDDYTWRNLRHNADLFPTEFKDAVMTRLQGLAPDSKFRAVELFSENNYD